MPELTLTVTDFVALVNQTFEYAYPSVTIVGELANFRISKNRWVYFDLQDEYSSVKFFATVVQLPGPLEDGLMLKVRGVPRLHPQYGFSVNVQFMSPVGEGSLKKAAALLEAKLRREGLFDDSRKRPLPYPPTHIGLITSGESAAYHDFVKILHERWGGVEAQLADVQVQGEAAPSQIATAIQYFNSHAQPVDVLVITRGGGSTDDLAAFSTELVTRAVASSRIPVLVAIGHEVDISLAELAADRRASTPSNAAQLLVPDRRQTLIALSDQAQQLFQATKNVLTAHGRDLRFELERTNQLIGGLFVSQQQQLKTERQLLTVLNPATALQRGYVILRQNGQVVRSRHKLQPVLTDIQFADGHLTGIMQNIKVE